MAYTENEIYYPYDYDASADVPEDMKTMAESIDEVVGEIKSTQTSQNNRLSTLETGQTSQGTRITNLETDNTTNKTNITNLQAENTRLKKNQIYGTATGTEVEITDGAEMGASIGVSGESEQETRSGKNKFNIEDWVTKGNNSNYYSYENGQLSINALDNRSFENFVEEDRLYLPNGNYYLSGNGSAVIRIYSDNNSAIVVSNNFTVTLGYIYLKLVSSNVITCKPQIEEGSVATDYEPYGAMPSPEFPSEIKNLTGDTVCKVRGKNMLDRSKCTENVALVWATGSTFPENGSITSDFIGVLPNQKIVMNYLSQVFFYNNNKQFISYLSHDSLNYFSVPNNNEIKYVRLGFRQNANTGIDLLNANIQVEEGENSTPYELYQEKTITFPFGEQKLRKDGYLETNDIYNDRTSITLTRQNGNWSFGANFSSHNKIVVTARVGLVVSGSGIRTDFLCSHFKVDSTIYADNDNIGCYINSTGNINFAISYNTIGATSSNTNVELLELFLTWLDDNPITIEYELAEPTLTPYTTAQQEAYNNLQNLILFEGYNHIEMISPNGVKANLTVDYTKSTQMVINDIEERLSALEYAGLEG